MACPLFRELKLGLLAHGPTEGVFSTVVLTDVGSISKQQSGRAFELCMYYRHEPWGQPHARHFHLGRKQDLKGSRRRVFR